MTRRTTFRKAFLAPWDPRVGECWFYSLAYAQHKTDVALHHAARVITHHHLTATLTKPNVGEFLHRFHHDFSCALNALLAEQRYDQPRNVFDKRSTHKMRLLDAPAQASHCTYEYLNTVAAGLVARPEHMPGTVIDWGHWKSGGIVVKRPDVFFTRDRPDELFLELTPPPLLMLAFDGDLDGLVHHMRKLSEAGIRALRDARKRPPLGAQKLQRLHPWNEPKTMADPGGRPVPTFKVGARGLIGKLVECAAAQETTDWRGEYRTARLDRLTGHDAVFPHGTYAMRVFHGVKVAEPSPHAIVAQPGPLLDELELGSGHGARTHVIEEVSAAWREEAAEVVAFDDLDFVDASELSMGSGSLNRSSKTASAADARSSELTAAHGDDRPEPQVRHRFHRERDDAAPHPRRLIVERDRRRGRPRRPKRDSDPPL